MPPPSTAAVPTPGGRRSRTSAPEMSQHLGPEHPTHAREREAEVLHLAVGDRVARPLEGEEEDGIRRRRARRGPEPRAQVGEQTQLAAPLAAIEAADLGVDGDER